MRPIVNMPEKDQTTDMGNTHKKLAKVVRGSGDILADRQTQTDILITILRTAPAGEVLIRRRDSERELLRSTPGSYPNSLK